jgi:peptide/nickel transport system substrate-binding protein
MRRLTVFLFAFILAALPLQSYRDRVRDTLLIATGADVITFNPVFATDGGSQEATAYLWPLPFEVDPVSGLAVPGLTSWTISEDGLTYAFTIREDAVWSDGAPITSADAKFTYDAFAADVVASPKQSQATALGQVNVVDEKTFEIVLDNVNCGIWGLMANMRWIPAHKFQADFSDIATNPLNTGPDISGGPYVLEEWSPDEFQRYSANPNYWAGQPQIPQLVVRVMPEVSVRVQALQAGDVDYAALSPDQFEQLKVTERFNVASFPDYEVVVLIMNHADPTDPQPAHDENGDPVEQKPHPIFGDVLVRRAVVMGYDKDAVLDALGGAGTRTAASIVPTISWAYNPDLKPWSYDPEAAAALLDEAGWTLNSATESARRRRRRKPN